MSSYVLVDLENDGMYYAGVDWVPSPQGATTFGCYRRAQARRATLEGHTGRVIGIQTLQDAIQDEIAGMSDREAAELFQDDEVSMWSDRNDWGDWPF